MRSNPKTFAFCIAAILFVALLDLFTPNEFRLLLLYLIPLAFAAPHLAISRCLILSLCATVAWLAADILTAPTPLVSIARIWNTTAQFLVFQTMTALIHHYSLQLREKESAIRLQRELKERSSPAMGLRKLCHGCGAVQSSSGDWLTITTWLTRDCNVAWADSECPECRQQQS